MLATPKAFVSTCDVPDGFEPVDIVFVVRHADKPAFGALPLEDVIAAAANDLKAASLKIGGQAVAGASFEVLGSNLAAVDVLAIGTAVRQKK